jgi:trk system potassium uptake protein
MKYIILGLGNFGASLAQKLTEQGNEVIGIDKSMEQVDALKNKISHTICMDATDQFTVPGLPIKEADVVIVAIGENEGANIMATAILKNLGVKRLIARTISALQETVLQAIGVDEIVHPEEETAERWAKKLCMNGVVESFDLDGNYSIVEIKLPAKYIGKTMEQVGFRSNYDLVVLTTLQPACETNTFGAKRNFNKVQGVASYDTVLLDGDILVVYGENANIKKFLKA